MLCIHPILYINILYSTHILYKIHILYSIHILYTQYTHTIHTVYTYLSTVKYSIANETITPTQPDVIKGFTYVL